MTKEPKTDPAWTIYPAASDQTSNRWIRIVETKLSAPEHRRERVHARKPKERRAQR